MTVDGERRTTSRPSWARLTDRHVRYGAVHAFPLVEPESGRAIGSATWGNAILTREPIVDGFDARSADRPDDDAGRAGRRGHPSAGVRYGDAEPGHSRAALCGRRRVDRWAARTVVTTHLTYIGRRAAAGAGRGARRAVADGTAGPVVADRRPQRPDRRARAAPRCAATFADAFAAVGIPPGDARRRSCGRAADRPRLRPRADASSRAASPPRPATRPITGRWSRTSELSASGSRSTRLRRRVASGSRSTWSASSASRARAPSTTAAGALLR